MSALLWAATLGLAVAAPEKSDEKVAENIDQQAAPTGPNVRFGSYGRVFAGTDTTGGAANVVDVVSRQTRLEKGTYAELDVIFEEEGEGGLDWRAVITPAFAGEPFHYDGQWDADIALRNLYAEAEGGGGKSRWHSWAGARMWRGDDLYLFDFWPLDELNMVGAGAGVGGKRLWAKGAVGVNRLTGSEWQLQSVDVVTPGDVSGRSVEVLDRQRTLAALKVGSFLVEGKIPLRLQGYAELQRVPEGTRVEGEERVEDPLPADRGGILGLQLSTWGWADGSFAHLWYRYGRGLATQGELAVPTTGLAADRTIAGAREHLLAAAANHEFGPASLLFGAWLRGYQDADETTADWDDRLETALAVQPTYWITPWAGIAGELSHQRFVSAGVEPASEQPQAPAVTKLALMPLIQAKAGSMGRPRIRLQYVYSKLNEGARWLYPQEDARFQNAHQHSIGVGVEWWLNSATYRPGGIPQ
jgi:maltoporin